MDRIHTKWLEIRQRAKGEYQEWMSREFYIPLEEHIKDLPEDIQIMVLEMNHMWLMGKMK